jgi:hypothetical protein
MISDPRAQAGSSRGRLAAYNRTHERERPAIMLPAAGPAPAHVRRPAPAASPSVDAGTGCCSDTTQASSAAHRSTPSSPRWWSGPVTEARYLSMLAASREVRCSSDNSTNRATAASGRPRHSGGCQPELEQQHSPTGSPAPKPTADRPAGRAGGVERRRAHLSGIRPAEHNTPSRVQPSRGGVSADAGHPGA